MTQQEEAWRAYIKSRASLPVLGFDDYPGQYRTVCAAVHSVRRNEMNFSLFFRVSHHILKTNTLATGECIRALRVYTQPDPNDDDATELWITGLENRVPLFYPRIRHTDYDL